ncbi:MAG: ribonuclease Z [Methanomicrobiales archaeon]|nr:ribonuclease Z [Methanomicrobiales archaeon]
MEIISGETLQIFFLGTSGALPTISRNLPCILLKWGSHDLIFDCGEGSQRQMMKARAGFSPEAIYISHWHADHFLGIVGLLQTMSFGGREQALTIVGPDCVHEIVTDITRLCRTKLSFTVESVKANSGDVLIYEGYSIRVFDANHGIPGVGYIFEENMRAGRFNREKAIELGIRPGPLFGKLQRGSEVVITVDGKDKIITPGMVMGPLRPGRKIIYTGDTRPVLSELTEIGQDADLLIHDATFDRQEEERAKEFMHATAAEAGIVAQTLKAHRLALFHFSTRYTSTDSHIADAKAHFSGEIIAPEDLDIIDIPFRND